MFSSKFNPIHSQHEDINDQFIRNVDYGLLEAEYGVTKYYPNYVHNPSISTPELKSLIEDKPIYKQVKNKQFKKELRKNQRKQMRQLKQQQREERKEARDSIRGERQELKEMAREEKRERREQRRSSTNMAAAPTAPAAVADPYKQETQFRQRHNSYQPVPLSTNNTMNSTNTTNGTNGTAIQHEYRGHYMKLSNSYEINNNGINRSFSFDNDSDKTEVEEIEEAEDEVDPLATDGLVKSFQSTTLTNTLNHSLSLNNNNNNLYDDSNSSKMKRGNSFDQSKSYLTNLRNKFKFHRRGSEQFGMYNLLFLVGNY